MTAEDLTDFLETTIDDSFDLGWTSRDAATLIVSRMQAEGLVMAPAQPAADLVEALKELLHAYCSDTGFAAAVRQDTGLAYPWEPGEIAEAKARAALSRYAGGA